MPPKDEFKFVNKNLSIADLKQIATHANIDIKSLTKKPELLKAIKSVDPPFPKRYNLLRNKWSSDPADATEPSTTAQPKEEEEEEEDLGTDYVKLIQKITRGRKGRDEVADLKLKKNQEEAINTIQKITRGRKARAEVADLAYKKTDAYKNRFKIAAEKGKEKARAQRAKEEEEAKQKKATHPPSPKAAPAQVAAAAPPVAAAIKQPAAAPPVAAAIKQPAAAPPAPKVAAVIPRTQAQKDKDEGPPEEGQFKKITRKNVGDIDDNVKVHIKSNVSPTVTAAAIAKQLHIINQRRFKIGHANIIYHRLGGIAKKATDFL